MNPASKVGKIVLLAAFSLLMAALSGCSLALDATLDVHNDSGTDIYYLYVSPSSSDTWGSDQLGSTILFTGDTFTVTDIPPGSYDILALDDSDNTVHEEYGLYLDSGEVYDLYIVP